MLRRRIVVIVFGRSGGGRLDKSSPAFADNAFADRLETFVADEDFDARLGVLVRRVELTEVAACDEAVDGLLVERERGRFFGDRGRNDRVVGGDLFVVPSLRSSTKIDLADEGGEVGRLEADRAGNCLGLAKVAFRKVRAVGARVGDPTVLLVEGLARRESVGGGEAKLLARIHL